jgi:small subunit ribosomal protein S5
MTQQDATPPASSPAEAGAGTPAGSPGGPAPVEGAAAPQTTGAPQAAAGGDAGGPPEQQSEGGGGRRGGRGGGGRGGGRGRSGGRGRDRERERDESGVESSVVRIYRCSKVVKGGRTFSFGALVVAGDRRGNVGLGYGKANEVPPAVEKATKDARKQMVKVNLRGTTIPHVVTGTSGASTVVLVPARPGTGVTAGKSVRPCLELVGITDILTKAYGSTSPKNLVKATMAALVQLRNRDQVELARGVKLVPEGEQLVAAAEPS